MYNHTLISKSSGEFSIIFWAWKDGDSYSYESLDCQACAPTSFTFLSKKGFEEGEGEYIRYESEYLNENINDGGLKEIIMEEVCEEFGEIKDDTFFEVIGKFTVSEYKDYWGEYSTDDEVDECQWQEISKDEVKTHYPHLFNEEI